MLGRPQADAGVSRRPITFNHASQQPDARQDHMWAAGDVVSTIPSFCRKMTFVCSTNSAKRVHVGLEKHVKMQCREQLVVRFNFSSSSTVRLVSWQAYIGSTIPEEHIETDLTSYTSFANDLLLLVDSASEVSKTDGANAPAKSVLMEK